MPPWKFFGKQIPDHNNSVHILAIGIVVWLKVAYIRVMGSFPTQWTGLSTELVCVGSKMHNPTVCTRSGGHHRQMKAQSHLPYLTEHAYRHPILWDRVV